MLNGQTSNAAHLANYHRLRAQLLKERGETRALRFVAALDVTAHEPTWHFVLRLRNGQLAHGLLVFSRAGAAKFMFGPRSADATQHEFTDVEELRSRLAPPQPATKLLQQLLGVLRRHGCPSARAKHADIAELLEQLHAHAWAADAPPTAAAAVHCNHCYAEYKAWKLEDVGFALQPELRAADAIDFEYEKVRRESTKEQQEPRLFGISCEDVGVGRFVLLYFACLLKQLLIDADELRRGCNLLRGLLLGAAFACAALGASLLWL